MARRTHRGTQRASSVIKRMVDIALSSAGLVLTCPIQAFTAIVIWAAMGRPIFFRQERPGREGKPFTLVKFRTMVPATGCDQGADDLRLTPLGRYLRSWSIDELPELWNVFRGDMSLVGPRPLLTDYLRLYSPHQRRRHEVRPGLTGLAQVSGRNTLTWDERLDLDVQYVDSWTVRGDLIILWKSVATVLSRKGISAEGSPTMHRFRGASRQETASDA